MKGDKPAVLVVDDEEMIREVLVRQLERLGYSPQAVASGHEAVEAMLPGRYDAVLLDIGLPDIDGLETLRRLLLIDQDLAVLMVTGQTGVSTAVKALRSGAHDYLLKPIEIDQVQIALERALELQRLRRERREEDARLRRLVHQQAVRLEQSFLGAVTALAKALEAKDPYTAGHSERVTRYALELADAVGLGEEAQEAIRLAGPLHDIGKIAIRDEILEKKEKLTDEEWAQIKQHPMTGARILEGIEGMSSILPIVKHHHERWDGKGYPAGLSGNDIPLEAQVIAVADAFDAMTSDRAYRRALSWQAVQDEFIRCAGQQWDEKLVQAFLGLVEDPNAD